MKSAMLTAILTGCCLSMSDAVTAQDHGAERIVLEHFYDLSDSLFSFPCSDDGELLPEEDGELIEVEGQIYERLTLHTDGAEGLHYQVNTMPVDIRGVGIVSGEEFRIKEGSIMIAKQRLSGLSGSFRDEFKLVGKTTHRTYRLVSRGHYVIAEDGTVKVSRDTLTTECR
jgi:hypothetical protein